MCCNTFVFDTCNSFVLPVGHNGESALEDGSPRFRSGYVWFEAPQPVTSFPKKLSPLKSPNLVTH